MLEKPAKAKILICEDEIIVASDLEMRLTGFGYDVCGIAGAGREALEMVERCRPDLVMMDIVIQGDLDGIEIAEDIRTQWEIPVVFISAYTDSERLARAKLAYPFGYIIKPIDDRELKITTEMALYVAQADAVRKKSEEQLSIANRLYSVLSNVNESIMRLREPDLIFQEACRVIVREGEFLMCWIGITDTVNNKMVVVAKDGVNGTYLDNLEISLDDVARGRGPTGRAFREKKYVICSDIQNDPGMAPWRENALRHGFRSSASFPLIVDNTVRGTLNLYSSASAFFDKKEIDLLDRLATTISYALEFADRDKERAAAVKELRDSKERFRLLADASSAAIFFTKDGYCLDANQVAADMFGYDEPTDFIGRFGTEIIAPECRALVKQNMLTGRYEPYEAVGLRKDGSQFPIHISAKPMPYKDKGIIRAASVVDISERKKAEKALKESEEIFRTIFDKSPFPKALTEMASGELIDVNDAFCQKVGMEKSRLIGRTTTDLGFYSQRDRAVFVRLLAQKGRVDGLEMQLKTTRGTLLANFHAVFITRGRKKYVLTTFEDITERKNAVEALRRSEQRKELALAGADLGTWDWDVVTGELKFNARWARMLGYPADALNSHISIWRPLMHPDDLPRVMARLNDHLEGRMDFFETELRARHKDGHWVWIFEKGRVIERGPDGAPLRVCGTHLDITDRKRAEAALRESEEKYRTLFNQSVEGIYLHDLEGNILDVNQMACEQSGFSRDELLRMTIFDFHPDPAPSKNLPREDILNLWSRWSPGDRQVLDVEHRRKDGKVYPVNLTTGIIRFGGRNLMLAIVQDITERKRAEEQIHRSETLYRSIAQQSGDGITLADTTGRFQMVNPTICQMSGYSEDELLDMNVSDLFTSGAEESLFEKVRNNEQDRCTAELLKKDGNTFLAEICGYPVDLEDQRHLLGTIRDITDHIRSNDEKKKLQAQLQQAQKMEAVGTLAGGVAHDFNNLLQAINGYTQLLLMDKSEDDPDYPSLLAIKNSGNRASDLVRSLLLFSRKAETKRRPLEMNLEIVHARGILERAIPKMVEIEVHSGNRLWTVMADPVQFEQILLNLGINAADAMPDGGKLIIETANIVLGEDFANQHSGARPGRYVQLTVTDTGHGMDAETQAKIYDPFFTTKEFGRGTGLGLASVYGIVKSHGGHILCYSEVGRGTTFKIYFPARDAPEVDEEVGQVPMPFKGGDETILLVDDEEMIRSLARQALTKFGYRVLTAASGEEALEVYTSRPHEIDLVIMDIGMPGMGGHRCLRELLAISPDARILIASGYSINGQVKESMEAGARGYIGKPYQLRDLLGRVRNVLDGETRE